MLDNTYWLTVASELILQEPIADIQINTAYTSNSRELVVDVDANVLPVFDSTRIHCQASADWILQSGG